MQKEVNNAMRTCRSECKRCGEQALQTNALCVREHSRKSGYFESNVSGSYFIGYSQDKEVVNDRAWLEILKKTTTTTTTTTTATVNQN